MSYIGQQPLNNFVTKQSQTFTPDGSTVSFILNFAVTSGIDIMLVINNVVQEPGAGKSYTASGTTLTMSEAPGASDSMYCIFLGLALQTVNPGDASVGTSKLIDSAVTNAKIANSTIDLTSKVTGTLPTANGGTGATSLINAGITSKPYFLRYSAAQSISTNTETVLQLTGAIYDTASYWDGVNYYYKPLVAGTYCIFAKQSINDLADFDIAQLRIYKNTTRIAEFQIRNEFADSQMLTLFEELNGTTDYIQFKAYHEKGSSANSGDGGRYSTYAGAFKLI